MIPKIIHYCWFGRGKMPELGIKCIESWKKYLPDYELRLWDENAFDINSVPFVKEAYESKKFAFVTDYVRLFALYSEGGVYMDTDVEVLKNLDLFLDSPAFTGFEDDTHIPTGIMASEKNGEWVKWQLKYYDGKSFIKEDGSFDTTTNVIIIGESMEKDGFLMNNKFQNFKNMIDIYPRDYFCPKSHTTGKIHLTENTVTIHHFAGSWKSRDELIKRQIVQIIGINTIHRIKSFLRFFK